MNQFNASSDLLIADLMSVSDGKTEVAMVEKLNKVGLDIIAKVSLSSLSSIMTMLNIHLDCK